MTIDLNRFDNSEEVVMPIVNGWGQIKGRKLYFNKFGTVPTPDGWYVVSLDSGYSVIKKASPLQVAIALDSKKSYKAYPMGQEAVPVNFDNFAQIGQAQSVHTYFMNARAFDIIKVVQWEDKRFYYEGPSLRTSRALIQKVREVFDKEQAISGIKGITPEIRYYFLVLSLQRQSVKELRELEAFKLSQAEKEERIKQFEATFAGRLQKTIEQAGGKLIKYYPYNKGYMVEWHLEHNGQTIKSIIADDMRIISLGYCASGADKEHSMASAIQLAKMYTEEAFLNITRE